MSTHRYRHDCPKCVFMGQHGEYDLYYLLSWEYGYLLAGPVSELRNGWNDVSERTD